ncbi:hypothetical protein CYMTET_28076 [Cymbomonas tetramitiformis]|uniref:Thiaminase-2/PQQC domain-containing protein n=1 Tax=Cymbomonas tetramitiformis TaxID=36881 RepID=A0AAE0KWA5_9CHLO|nr:hypothetical protein CYMTET_28076 [Cymbomonas tetramitiformis]
MASLSESFWADSSALTYAALHHPFVVGIGAGTLPLPTFQAFILEDAFFLTAFAKAYAFALTKCSDSTLVVNLASLLQGVRGELEMHGSYAEKWGVQLNSEAEPNSATTAYSCFLLDTANSASTASILAAMAPCMRLYQYLGERLTQAVQASGRHDHPYVEWISTYSTPEFARLVQKMEESLNLAASLEMSGKGGATTTSPSTLRSLYMQAMACELAFFDAQPGTPLLGPNVALLCTDFDGTCTQDDTLALLPALAAEAARGGARPPAMARESGAEEPSPRTAEEVEAAWVTLKKNYASGYEAVESLLLEAETRLANGEAPKVTGIYDVAGLNSFLSVLSNFEVAANEAVVRSRVLAGIPMEDIAATAAALALRPGCLQLLPHLKDAGVPVRVLSVNWSAELICAALELPAAAIAPPLPAAPVPEPAVSGPPARAGRGDGRWWACLTPWSEPVASAHATNAPRRHAPDASAPSVQVLANDLEVNLGWSTGNLLLSMQTPLDKGNAFNKMLKSFPATKGLRVYVGDSTTDLPALLAADVGIVIGESPSLRRVVAAFQLRLEPLICAAVDCTAAAWRWSSAGTGRLFTVTCWQEIVVFFGFRGIPAALPTSSIAMPAQGVEKAQSRVDVTLCAVTGVAAHSMLDAVGAAIAGGATLVQIQSGRVLEEQIQGRGEFWGSRSKGAGRVLGGADPRERGEHRRIMQLRF